MIITRNDIINEIDRYNWAFHKNYHINNNTINTWVKKANEDSYWIQNEGLWAWIQLRMKEI